jgi:hypothetical protein
MELQSIATACVIGLGMVLVAGSGSAHAQRAKPVPQAFAVVQAPEAAVEVCHGASARAALDCARARCQRKASAGSCFAVTVCQPPGWAGLMGVQLSEVHFTSAICGAPTQEAAIAALRAFCQGHAGMRQCAVARLWAPNGNLVNVDLGWSAADFNK